VHAEEVADAHQRPGARFGVTGADFTAPHRFAEAFAITLGQPLVVFAEHRLVDELGFLHDAVQAGMLLGELQKALKAVALGFEPVDGVAGGGEHLLAQLAADVAHQGDENLFLAVEVEIERALADAGPGGDGTHRSRVKSLAAEFLFGGAEQLAPGRFTASGDRHQLFEYLGLRHHGRANSIDSLKAAA